jgi:ethanolamine utilization microcompartment shell protein EutS
MRKRNISALVIDRLAAHPAQRFANEQAWQQHLEALGVMALKVHPDPALVATEGALWGAIAEHGFLDGAVILSDDAGQFNIGEHALRWVHAERLIYKLNAFTEVARQAKEQIRGLVWNFYKDLKSYKTNPSTSNAHDLRQQFDGIFTRKTGFVALDRLLTRLRANKTELLKVLDRPDIPLHTNGSENDIRCQVTRRKISGTTRSDQGRDCRDAFLSLTKTCLKLDISFWDYLGDRLHILPNGSVPYLPDLVASRT